MQPMQPSQSAFASPLASSISAINTQTNAQANGHRLLTPSMPGVQSSSSFLVPLVHPHRLPSSPYFCDNYPISATASKPPPSRPPTPNPNPTRRRARSLSSPQSTTPRSASPRPASSPTSSAANTPISLPSTHRKVCALFSQAKKAERAGQFHNARHLLLQCLALDVYDAHSWLALARLQSRGSDSEAKQSETNASSSQADDGPSVPAHVSLARSTFEEGLCHCPDNVHLLHAWAVMEHRSGDHKRARTLFSRAYHLQPDNPYVCHAWGILEQRDGNISRARELFAKSIAKRPHSAVSVAWAILEGRDGHVKTARVILKRALVAAEKVADPSSLANIFCAWAQIEERIGDLPKARDLLSKAIASHPTHTDAYVALAKLEARRGSTTRAIELIRAAAKVTTKAPPSLFNAWAHIEWGSRQRIDEARNVLKQGISLHPKDPALLQSLGTLEQKCGDYEKAKYCYQASVSARPKAPAYVAWALLEESQGNYDQARRLFEKSLSADALHGAAYNAYGMMEARCGDEEAARNVFERGVGAAASASVFHGFAQFEVKVGRNPQRARELFRRGAAHSREDTVFVWHSWGVLELRQNEVESARKVFREAIKRYPRNSQILVGAALSEAASCPGTCANESRAREFFKEAVVADPTHAHAWQTWGMLEQRCGNLDAAVALFRRGLRLCPTHGALWQAWGVLESTAGNFARARQLFRRGVDACPGHVHLFQAWACMEVRARNIVRARELLDAALEADPGHGPVWNAYGLLEARHGTLAKARQNFTTGIRRAPYHAPLYRTYGQTEARAGNFDRARQLFQQGLEVDARHAPLYHAFAKFEAMMGNLSGLGELKQKAERFFGSEAEATRVIRDGDEGFGSEDVVFGDENMELVYAGMASPMELALGDDESFADDDDL